MESSIETVVSAFIIIVIITWSLSSVTYLLHIYQQQEITLFLNSCAKNIALAYLNTKPYNNVNLTGFCEGKIGKGLMYFIKISLFYIVNGDVNVKVIYQNGSEPSNFVNKAVYYACLLKGNLTCVEVYVYGET
jgi:hypothetical protein